MLTVFIRGCRVSVSFFFLAAAALILTEDQSGTALLTFAAAALHETGHLLVMRRFRVRLLQVRFTPFGVDIEKSVGTDRSYPRDALISLSGPLTNLVTAALFYLFGSGCSLFILVNLALALFNLLPIEPLDGGQALYSLLCIRFRPEQSAKAVAVVSFLVLTPLAVVEFIALFRSPWNFSLFLTCVYLMTLLLFKNGRYY